MEFQQVCNDLGFGAVSAEAIFRSLDVDGGGSVSYMELQETLTSSERMPESFQAKSMLTALVQSLNTTKWEADQAKVANRIDTSKWVITARDAASVQSQLQALLEASGCHVAELISLFDDVSHASTPTVSALSHSLSLSLSPSSSLLWLSPPL